MALVQQFEALTGITSWSLQVMQRLEQFQENGILCDATLVAKDGALFSVHSCVLAAVSTSFRFAFLKQKEDLTFKTSLGSHDLEAKIKDIYTNPFIDRATDPLTLRSPKKIVPDSDTKTVLDWLLRDLMFGHPFCDTVLSQGEADMYYGHSPVLAAASPFLEKLLIGASKPYAIDANNFRSCHKLEPIVLALYKCADTLPVTLLESLEIELPLVFYTQSCRDDALATQRDENICDDSSDASATDDVSSKTSRSLQAVNKKMCGGCAQVVLTYSLEMHKNLFHHLRLRNKPTKPAPRVETVASILKKMRDIQQQQENVGSTEERSTSSCQFRIENVKSLQGHELNDYQLLDSNQELSVSGCEAMQDSESFLNIQVKEEPLDASYELQRERSQTPSEDEHSHTWEEGSEAHNGSTSGSKQPTSQDSQDPEKVPREDFIDKFSIKPVVIEPIPMETMNDTDRNTPGAETRLVCFLCEESFCSQELLIAHIQLKHSGGDQFIQTPTPRGTDSESSGKKRKIPNILCSAKKTRVETDQSVGESSCVTPADETLGQSVSEELLVPQVEQATDSAEQSDEAPLLCGYCQKEFQASERILWEVHIKREHNTRKLHRCPFCPEAFSDTTRGYEAMRKHQLIHNEDAQEELSRFSEKVVQLSKTADVQTQHYSAKSTLSELNTDAGSSTGRQTPVLPSEQNEPNLVQSEPFSVGNKGPRSRGSRPYPFYCEVCYKEFDQSNISLLRKHLQIHHLAKRTYCCDVCHLGVRTCKSVHDSCTLHKQNAPAPKVVAIAPKPVEPAESEATDSENWNTLSCGHCEKSFELGEMPLWETHIKKVHGGGKVYMCRFCGSGFAFMNVKLQHEILRHPQALSEVTTNSTEVTQLNDALAGLNQGIKQEPPNSTQPVRVVLPMSTNQSVFPEMIVPNKESDAPKGIGTKKILSLDAMNGKNVGNVTSSSSSTKPKGKKYNCSSCSLSFASRAILSLHMTCCTQTSSSLFHMCTICERQFVSPSLLYKHQFKCRQDKQNSGSSYADDASEKETPDLTRGENFADKPSEHDRETNTKSGRKSPTSSGMVLRDRKRRQTYEMDDYVEEKDPQDPDYDPVSAAKAKHTIPSSDKQPSRFPRYTPQSTQGIYRCEDCEKEFESENIPLLRMHLKREHKAKRIHICDLCRLGATCSEADHVSFCHPSEDDCALPVVQADQKPYRCEHCGKEYDADSIPLLKMHLRRDHQARSVHICYLCRLGTKNNLASHTVSLQHYTNSAFGSGVQGDFLGMVSAGPDSLVVDPDDSGEENSDGLLHCTYCDKTFEKSDEILWEMHIKKTHNISRVYKCRLCGVSLTSKRKKLEHESSHGQMMLRLRANSSNTNLSCSSDKLVNAGKDCQSTNNAKGKKTIQTESPPSCDESLFQDSAPGKSKKSSSISREPRERKVPLVCDEELASEKLGNQNVQAEKNVQKLPGCGYCTATFQSESVLQMHVKAYHPEHDNTNVEANQLPFQCLFCKRRFISEQIRRRHKARCSYKHFYAEPKHAPTVLRETSASPDPVVSGNSAKDGPLACDNFGGGLDSENSKSVAVKTEPGQHLSQKTSESFTSDGVGKTKPRTKTKQKTVGRVSKKTSSVDESPLALGKARLDALYAQFVEEADEMCRICGESFSTEAVLLQHVKVFHPRTPSHHCESCPLAFPTRVELLMHKIRSHPGTGDSLDEDKICSVCGESFTKAWTLEKHMRTRHQFGHNQ